MKTYAVRLALQYEAKDEEEALEIAQAVRDAIQEGKLHTYLIQHAAVDELDEV